MKTYISPSKKQRQNLSINSTTTNLIQTEARDTDREVIFALNNAVCAFFLFAGD